MGSAPPIHPSNRALADFGLGKLQTQDGDIVRRHMVCCARCRDIVVRTPPDQFLENVRAGYAGDMESGPAPRIEPSVPARGAEKSSALRGSSTTHSVAAVSSFSVAASRKDDDAVDVDSAAEFPPELLNHPNYRLIRYLGRGGMGRVYLATNLLLNRKEALKVIAKAKADRPAARQRFQQEIRAAAGLQHPNIVAVFNAFEAGTTLVFAMEYVEGKDLSVVVEELGPLSITKAAYYAYQAALGLQAAHESKMVHRDIKPENLMLSQVANRHSIKILDFGLAKAASEEEPVEARSRGLTVSGEMLGTPDFVAPEQTYDASSADIRADIYSLGCTLYYLLTGRRPFRRSNFIDTIQAQRTAEAEPIAQFRSDIPPGLANVVARMMQKQPENRFGQPSEVASALKPFFGASPSLSRAGVATSSIPQFASRNSSSSPGAPSPAPELSASAAGPASAAHSPSRLFRTAFFLVPFAICCFAAVLIAGRGRQTPVEPAAIRPAVGQRPFVAGSMSVVRSDDNSPVMALRKPPGQLMAGYLSRFKTTLTDMTKAMATGKAGKFDPVKEYNDQAKDQIWLESGTAVEVLEPPGAAQTGDAPPLGIKGDNPMDQLSNLAEEVNVKIRPLNGTYKDVELWVARERIRREYVGAATQ